MVSRDIKGRAQECGALRFFALAFGLLLGLALLKFPNPPVVEGLTESPNGFWEWLLASWPVHYGYVLIGVLSVVAIPLVRWPANVSKVPAMLPAAWLAWVGLSVTQSLNVGASMVTFNHLVASVSCFYLGLLVLGRVKQPGWFWGGIIAGFVIVLASGWQQHFGGLEATRRDFYERIYPTLKVISPEMLKRVNSDRIFSTLFYANSLAGALLLLTPLVLGLIADAKDRFTSGARWLLGGIVGAAAIGCLVWSGSKAGWLLALGTAGVALLRLPFQRRVKVIAVSTVLVLGMAGFAARYMGFFQRGATSVVARFDYWKAAGKNIVDHPVLGSGPGTFLTVFKKFSAPGAEPARLVHNDYLQQASDSGFLAAVFFAGFVGWVLASGRRLPNRGAWGVWGVWLGLAGLAMQSVVEFGFYVPATAWCWCALAGWLMARAGIGFDNKSSAA